MNTPNKNIESIYPLSSMQQGMLFHTLQTPNLGVYFEQLICTLHGDLNIQAFHQAWLQVVKRHQVLRSLFLWEHGKQPLQVVCKSVKLPWLNLDWQAVSLVEQQQRLETFLKSEREQGFKLDQAPLMRCTLIKVQSNTYQFIWSHHHLLIDGWCLSIILKEVLTFYETSIAGEKLYLTPAYPYKDYISWLQKQDISQAQAFWQRIVQGFTTPTPLIADRVKNHHSHPEQTDAEEYLLLPPSLTKNMQTLAQDEHLTLNTLVQGAWTLLLSHYSGEPDVLFGTTVSGRPSSLRGVESMVGLFINTLPVRVKIAPETQLLSWLKQLQAQLVELDEYAYTPLVEIQGWSDVPRGTPLFESLVVFENYPLDASLQQGSSSIKVSNVRSFERTSYPLTVVVTPGSQLSVQIKYDTHRFTAGTIQQKLKNLQTLLTEIVTNPQAKLSELQLLTPAEQYQLLVEKNITYREYPQDQCIHELFAEQVEKTPDAVAVVCADEQLTYQELNERANSLAHYLRHLGVGANVLVGISVERSLEMVVGLLAILKAGGAYVPLDPTYPVERLSLMLEDAQLGVLLTQQHLAHRLPQQGVKQVCLDADWQTIQEYSQHNPINNTTAENLAYVIYTSGSTGKPKGVLVNHSNVVRLFAATEAWYQFNQDDVWTMFHSYAFDFSVWEIWGALLYGGRLVVVPYLVTRNPESFYQLLAQEKVTVLNQTPSAFRQLIQAEQSITTGGDLNLRLVIFGGEALELSSLQPWFERHGDTSPQLVNMYGITETTVHVTYRPLSKADLQSTASVIGCPIPDLQVYLLDQNLQPVPIGVRGEMYVGGAGVTRGYLNRSELTQQRFIANPFAKTPGGRLYRTGDEARYLPNGELEYLGRIDNQVKIRGFRIELGELERLLAQHPSVWENVVIVREDEPGDKRLVAYVVPKSEQPVTVQQLRSLLGNQLPSYMIPNAFVVLESLPLTSNGKVDKRALPAPDTSSYVENTEYQAPRTPTQEVVAAVWLEVLGIQASVDANFFEVGGHSLLATQVISRLQKAFAVDLPLQYLFQYPTIAELSDCIDQLRQTASNRKLPAIAPVSRTENLPLSYAQQRLWFLDQLEGGSSTYNVPAALELKGALNPVALEQSLVAIVQRHEALRTSFPMVDGYPIQAIASDVNITLPVVDLQLLPEQEQPQKVQELILQAAAKPFDLANGPLLRANLLRLNAESHIIVLVMHHIICDGWSMGIFVSELSALYADSIKGELTSLPPLSIQYADFAYWQHQWLTGEVMDSHLAYWKQQLANLPSLELPTDRPRPAVQTFRGTRQNLALPLDLTAEIKALSRREATTVFMTLMAAFKSLLYCYTNQEDIVVGTDVANRNRVETERLIGFFVNQLVLRTNLSGNPSFRELLGNVRQTTLAAYDHQDMPFDQLVAALNPERDLSRTPLFQSKLVLQNAPTPALQLDELTLNIVEIDDGTAKFDLLLTLWETEQGIRGNLEYSTDLFNDATITRMLSDYQTILRTVVNQSNINLSALKATLAAVDKQAQAAKEQEFQQARRNKFKNLQLQSHQKISI